jgi:hypothetical protein
MKINRKNYEQYFLDHAEGNLSPEIERELSIFLEVNADLKPVLENFDASPLPSSEIKNESLKTRLKKNIYPSVHINETNVDEWLTREIEGILTESEATELQKFLLLNPAYEYDRKLFGIAKLTPNPSITFPRKAQLKKKAPVISLARIALVISASAAMILLIIGIRYINQPDVIENPQVILIKEAPLADVPAIKPAESGHELVKSDSKPNQPAPAAMKLRVTPSSAKEMSRYEPYMMEPNASMSLARQTPEFPSKIVESSNNSVTAKIQEPKSDKPLIAKVFGKIMAKGRKAVNENPGVEKVRNADVNVWTLAEVGVKGYNTISGRDVELLVRRDEQGKIKSYALVEEDRLLITKNLDKN